MRGTVSLSRVLAVISLLCLGSLAFLGCSSGGNSLSSTPGGDDSIISPDPLLLTTTIQGPTDPTAADIAAAVVKPDDVEEGDATFHPISFNMPGGRLLDLQGSNPAIDVDFDCDNDVDGAIPLFLGDKHKSIFTKDLAILPKGNNTFKLSPDSFIAAYLPKNGTVDSNFCVKVTDLCVKFTVLDDEDVRVIPIPTWTLPVSFDMCLNTDTNGRSVIKGSKLILRWDPSKGSIPPEDENGNLTAWIHANFYLGDKLVLSTTDCSPIEGDCNTVTFKGDHCAEFNRVDFCIDLRQKHTDNPNDNVSF